ncbi:hypothetical protein KZX50_22040, partial [Bacillus infantis]|uniref:hypothetical protein n=1 Tax=Bacillus infantis TaxID=324767 RepID=UPI002004B219
RKHCLSDGSFKHRPPSEVKTECGRKKYATTRHKSVYFIDRIPKSVYFIDRIPLLATFQFY